MINKVTAQILRNRLPLALLKMKPEVVSMLEFKWGAHDDLFHSIKATIKKFPEMKEKEIREYEDQAMEFIDKALSEIYRCLNCGNDLRKCGVLRQRAGVEIAEFYIAEDGKQSRTHRERFEASGKVSYRCLGSGCNQQISDGHAVSIFLKYGINKEACVDYMYKYHSTTMKSLEKNVVKGAHDLGNVFPPLNAPPRQREIYLEDPDGGPPVLVPRNLRHMVEEWGDLDANQKRDIIIELRQLNAARVGLDAEDIF